MIIIHLWGGLGNQMFQYAFYQKMRKIYDQKDTDIRFYYVNPKKLDHKSHWYVNVEYELDYAFDIHVPMASTGYVAKYSNYYPATRKKAWLYGRLFDMRSRVFGDKPSYIAPDDPTGYYPEVFELSPLHSWYLRGWWLNERYFQDIRDEVIDSFKFQIRDHRNDDLIREMESTNSVSIHLRNFEGSKVTSEYERMTNYLGRDYYEKAVDIIKSKVSNPKFYVFSNNPDWAKEVFEGLVDYRLVDHNKGRDSYLDMLLMSKCKHNVISNGTFGFWGAYLNRNPEKIVIASKKPHLKTERHNFICEGWIEI